MTNIVEIDFKGAPPAQGGGSDHIKRGRYAFKVVSADKIKARSGRDMIAVRLLVDGGTEDGARLRDQFVMPRSKDDSNFGLQRFNAFLEAVGYNIGEKKVKIDLDTLANKRVEADVVDDTYSPENGAPRDVSRLDAYYRIRGAAPAPAPNGQVAAQAEPELESEAEAEELAANDVEEPVVAAPRRAPARRTPPAEELDQVAEEADDLFA